MFNTVNMKCVLETNYFNHDVNAVDIPFIEMILHKNSFRKFTDFCFIKLLFLIVYEI